jgi:hypothetical protein
MYIMEYVWTIHHLIPDQACLSTIQNTNSARIELCLSRYFNSHSINGSSELFEDPIFNNELKSHVLFIYISKQMIHR